MLDPKTKRKYGLEHVKTEEQATVLANRLLNHRPPLFIPVERLKVRQRRRGLPESDPATRVDASDVPVCAQSHHRHSRPYAFRDRRRRSRDTTCYGQSTSRRTRPHAPSTATRTGALRAARLGSLSRTARPCVRAPTVPPPRHCMLARPQTVRVGVRGQRHVEQVEARRPRCRRHRVLLLPSVAHGGAHDRVVPVRHAAAGAAGRHGAAVRRVRVRGPRRERTSGRVVVACGCSREAVSRRHRGLHRR